LLLEILVTVAVMSVVVGLGSQMIIASIRSGKVSNERNVALGLAEEMSEAVGNIASEKWQNIYGASKGAANHHYPQQASGKWVLTNGDEAVMLNGVSYTRYFTIDNASRDVPTREIETSYNALNDDPSTQKITIYVVWNGETVTYNQFLSRWRNRVCRQTDWSGVSGGSVEPCSTGFYGNENGDVDFSSPGSLRIKPL